MKIERIMKEKAKELGLEYLGMENRSRHARMSFKNREGKTLIMTAHYTDRDSRHTKQDLNRLERFADCEYMPTMIIL